LFKNKFIKPKKRNEITPIYWLTNKRDKLEILNDHDEFIQSFFDSRAEYEGYINEWKKRPLQGYLIEAITRWEDYGFEGGNNFYYLPVYAYVRKTKPSVLVETGVKDGWATMFLLSALEENGCGKLYSIDQDVNNWDYRDSKDSGWVIPTQLKNSDRWELRRGEYRPELLKLCCEVEGIDLFNHDSKHTFHNMIFEYECANMKLGRSGAIFSDNIYKTKAFDVFASNYNYSGLKLAGGLGLDHSWWCLNGPQSDPKEDRFILDNIGMLYKEDKNENDTL